MAALALCPSCHAFAGTSLRVNNCNLSQSGQQEVHLSSSASNMILGTNTRGRLLNCTSKSETSATKMKGSTVCSLADRAVVNVEQTLRRLGVETNETRTSLLLALTLQAARQTEKAAKGAVGEASKYVLPKRGDARNLEEALMSVPDLETVSYRVVKRSKGYEVRDVDSYLVAETDMGSENAFDFFGSSRSFNTLAGYLFGKNRKNEGMEMTTPVISSRGSPPAPAAGGGKGGGDAMDMTVPVVTSQQEGGRWRMAFVMPSKYTEDTLPLPVDFNVTIRRVPAKTVAVAAFSGFVTDSEAKRRESALRQALAGDAEVRVKPDAPAEVAQFNPPFTLPFQRRNEIAIEVEYTGSSY
eukprot:jgi/Mesen1/7326/ME000376S06485